MATLLPVPESEQRVLDNLLRDLNETYPDKVIIRLQQDHKKWYEKVTRLYKNIGYSSRDEFLAAYGFTEEKGKSGRPTNDLNAIVEDLLSRYEGDKYVTSIDQLKNDNPDLAPKLKSLQNKAKDLFGMSFNNFLKEKGVFKSDKLAAEDKNKEYETKLAVIFGELKKRYEGKELPRTLVELKESNADLENIANIGPWIERVYGVHASEYLLKQGLMQAKEKKPEKTEEQKKAAEFRKLAAEEKLRTVTEELKKRVAEDGEKVLAKRVTDIVDDLGKRYPDLPIKSINTWVRQTYPGKNIKTYLIEQGIIQSIREYCLSRIEHIDKIDFSKNKLLLEVDGSRAYTFIQTIGKTKAIVPSVWAGTGDCYFVMNTDNKDPMKGKYWDAAYILDPSYKLKFISEKNVLEILNEIELSQRKKKSFSVGDNPIESFCLDNLTPALYEEFLKKRKVDDKLFGSVKYRDSEQIAPKYVVECAIVPYMQQLEEVPTQYGEYKTDYSRFIIIPDADKVAATLDPNTFTEMLENLIGGDLPSVYHTLVPYGRFVTGQRISKLATRMNTWRNWDEYSAKGRKSIIVARGAIMLNDSREAMLIAEKADALGYYASIRGMDPDVLRDSTMSDFGLDKNGRKMFDLGNTMIEVSVTKELKLQLYDTKANKEVKSIPKRGADPDKYEKAKAEFADIKKNLKDIVKTRKDLLFGNFISGTSRKPQGWRESYLNNYILHKIGEIVVWNQGNKRFILSENGILDCYGNEYEINDEDSISVAHPMLMSADERKLWQQYFTSHGLKQPFEQVWEPVIDMESFKPNRYEGCMIPYYRFLKREKHGIKVYDYDFHNDISFMFSGFSNVTVNRIDWSRHSIDMDDRFEIKSLTPYKPSRITNHILAYFDRITIEDRVAADDTTVVQMLSDCSLPQIMGYINIANESNANNVLAVLMDYKNANYSDFDPMDEFVLD